MGLYDLAIPPLVTAAESMEKDEPLLKQSLDLLESTPAEVEPWRVRTARKSYADLLRRMRRIKEADEMEKVSKARRGPTAAYNGRGFAAPLRLDVRAHP
jgi:hypothetical protein